MTPILTSWARMALLAVPFADPFLIGLVKTPEADAVPAGENGDTGTVPEATAAAPTRSHPACDDRSSQP
jgi:hypothetical protein